MIKCNVSCKFLDHIKTSVCPAPGSFPWPIIKCRSKVPNQIIGMLFLLLFLPFSLKSFKSFLALIRGSATLTGRWSWKFLVINSHKMQRFASVMKEVLRHMHRWNLHSCLLVLLQSCQRFHHLFRKKLGKRMVSKQSLQIRKIFRPIMSS